MIESDVRSVRPQPAPGVEVEDLDDETCLYRADINEVVVLNRSAADVWHLADGTATTDDIAHTLVAAYQIDDTASAAVTGEVERVVEDLLTRGYLTAG